MTSRWENLSSGEHDLLLSGGAGTIEAKLHIPKADDSAHSVKAIAICCHPHPLFGGAMTNKVVHTVTKTFTRMGIATLRFNFRGVGKSAGIHGEGLGESEDLLALCRLMRSSWSEQELWLAGFSFGSWITARCAKEAKADRLLSIAPPVQYFDFNDAEMAECPWLVLMGEKDEIIDPELVYHWIKCRTQPPELITFPEAGHFFHGQIVKMSSILQQHYGPDLGYKS